MNRRCTYCGRYDHPTQLCPKTWNGQGSRARLYYGYCGSHKHSIDYCPGVAGGIENRHNNPEGEYLD